MHTIADITAGRAFQADDPEALTAVFAHIDKMKKSKFEEADPLEMDCFQPIAIAGLILLGLHIIALFGIRYTPW